MAQQKSERKGEGENKTIKERKSDRKRATQKVIKREKDCLARAKE